MWHLNAALNACVYQWGDRKRGGFGVDFSWLFFSSFIRQNEPVDFSVCVVLVHVIECVCVYVCFIRAWCYITVALPKLKRSGCPTLPLRSLWRAPSPCWLVLVASGGMCIRVYVECVERRLISLFLFDLLECISCVRRYSYACRCVCRY
jgi:hypothetical protein